MPINNNSLDPVVASLISGGIKRNPAYNPNTKKGREQPQFIQDTNPAAVYDLGAGIARQSKKISYGNADLGLTPEEWNKEVDKGAVVSPYYNSDERYKLKYAKQGLFEKVMNSAIQLFGSEALLGAAKTVFDIGDRLVHVFKEEDNDDFRSDILWGIGGKIEDAQDYLRDEFEIFQKNPDKNFQLSDPGWWFQNVTNVGSSISFYLGGLGIAKTAGLIGKIGIGGKNLSNALKAVNLAVTKTGSAIGAIKNPYTAANALGATEDIFATAFLSRTAEGQMEARETYKNVQADVKEKLNKMSDEEYADFIARNKNIHGIENMSREDAANVIASNAAKDTFADDYAMLFMDFMQIKSLKNMWKGFSSRAATSGIRSAQDAVLNRLVGVAESETTKGFLSRTGAKLLDSAKHFNPFTSIPLNEGVEEFYQGAAQQESEDKAKFAIDGKHRVRGLGDYLQDTSLWEQAFWGVAGGWLFEKSANALNYAKRKLDAKRKGEDFVSEDRARIAEIQARVEGFNKLVNGLNTLNEGFIPGQYETDKKGDIIYDNNNNPIRRKVKTDINGHSDTSEIEAAKNRLFNEFITEYGIYAAENGNSDLLKVMIKDKRMNQFFDKQLKDSDVTADGFQQRLLDSLDETYNEYNKHYLSTMNSVKDADDSIARFTAKQIIRINNNIKDVNNKIARANAAINGVVPAGETINEDYVDHARSLIAAHKLRKIEEEKAKLNDAITNGKISKVVYDRELAELKEEARQIGEIAFPSHSDEVFPSIHGILSLDDKSFSSAALLHEIEQTFYDLRSKEDEFYIPAKDFSTMPQNVQNAYVDRAMLDFTKRELEDLIPKDKNGYKKLYDNYFDRLSEEASNKRKESIINIREWLKQQDDVDAAFDKLMRDGADGKFDDELLLLRLGANDASESEKLLLAEVAEIKRKRAEEEKRANSTNINGISRPNQVNPSTGKPSATPTNTTAPQNVAQAATQSSVQPETSNTQPAASSSEATATTPTNETVSPEEAEAIAAMEEQFDSLDLDSGLSAEEEAAFAALDEEQKTTEAASETFNALRNYMANLEEKIPSEEFLNPNSVIINDLRNNVIPTILRGNKMDESLIDNAVNDAINSMISLAKRVSNKSNSMNETIDNAENEINDSENSDIVSNAVTKYIKGKLSEEEAAKFKEKYDEFVDNIVLKYIDNDKIHVRNTTRGKRVTIDGLSFIEYVISEKDITPFEAKRIIAYLYDYIYYSENHVLKNNNDKGITIEWKNKSSLNELLKNPSDVYARIIENRRITEEKELDTRMHIKSSTIKHSRYNEAVEAAKAGSPIVLQLIELKGTNKVNIGFGVNLDSEFVELGFISPVIRGRNGDTISLYNRPKNNIHLVINIKEGKANGTNVDDFMDSLLNDEKRVEEANQILDIISKDIWNITDRDAKSVKDNPLFKMIYNKSIIHFDDNVVTDIEKMRATLIAIKNLVFGYDDISTGKKKLYSSFLNRVKKYYNNYLITEKIYSLVNGQNIRTDDISIKFNGGDKDFVVYDKIRDIKDSELDPDKNPIIVFNNNVGIDENGNKYSNPAGFKNGTMGMLVENKKGTPIVALFKDSKGIKTNKEFSNAVHNEIVDIIRKFQTREYDFETVSRKLQDLLANKSHIVGFSLIKGINVIEKNNVIIISDANIRGKGGVIATIYKYKNNTSTFRGTGVSYNTNHGHNSSITYNEDIAKHIADGIVNVAKFNPSWYTINKKNDEEDDDKYYTVNKGYINIKIGDYTRQFNSFGHFAKEMNAFTTNHNNVVTKIDKSIYMTVTSSTGREIIGEHEVKSTPESVLRQSEGKEVDVKDLMKAAGFDEKEIDELSSIRDNEGNNLIADKLIYDSLAKNGNNANAYYSGESGNIYITPKGAKLISNVRTGKQELKRLLIHENLHRHFRDYGVFDEADSPKTKKRIDDIIETFDRFKEVISDDNYAIDKVERNAIIRLMNTLEKDYRNNRAIFAEEWVTEAISQKVLAKHLNNILFDESGNRDDISDVIAVDDNKKTFFTRIIESLIKLFNGLGAKINNHSILARQYYILSQLGEELNEIVEVNREENNNENNNENKEEVVDEDKENSDEENTDEDDSSEDTLDDINDDDSEEDDLEDFSDVVTFAVTDYIEEGIDITNDKSYTNSMSDLNKRFTAEEQAFIGILQARQELIYKCGL